MQTLEDGLMYGVDFAKAARSAGVYLGDTEAVAVLMQSFIAALADAYGEGDAAKVTHLADVEALRFAGQMDGFTPIPDWASRENLGLYAAKHWSLQPDGGLVEILRGVFLMAASTVGDIIIAAHGGEADDQTQFRIDMLVEALTATMTNTWEIVYPPEDEA